MLLQLAAQALTRISTGGDFAVGLLFASGNLAIAPVSLGASAIGLLSFGGCAVGLISLGGFSVGLWSFGEAAGTRNVNQKQV